MSSGKTALAIFAFYLLLTSATTLWDRDEPRFAQAAVEMVRSGHYLYPTFRGDVRAQKPILIYWLMALSITVLGASEIAVRFWAPVGIAVTAYATHLIARRLLSPRIGWLAMLVVALNPLAQLEGTAATTDAVLMALVTCAIAAFAWRLTSKAALLPAATFGACLAGALLAKGPVGLLPLLVAAGTLWQLRARADARRIAAEFSAAAAIGGALFLLWAIPANLASGGRFYTQGVEHDIVERVLEPLEGHGGNLLLWLPFYPAVLLIGLAPWSVFVPAALHTLWRRDRPRSEAGPLLTWWMAGPIVVFSAAATHLPHYILPAWPALSLAVASVIDAVLSGEADERTRRWIARAIPIAMVPAIVACAALVGAPFVLHLRGLLWRSAPVVLVVGAAAGVVVLSLRRAEYRRAVLVCLSAAVAFQGLMGLWWLPGMEAVKPVPRIAETVRRQTRGTVPVATYGFSEPSLDFYLDRIPGRLATSQEVRSWSEEPDAGVLITTRAELTGIGGLPALHEIDSSEGFNVANGRQVELVVLERALGRTR